MRRWKQRVPRGQQPGQPPIELVLVPDPPGPPGPPPKPSPLDHLEALARRASLQGKRRYWCAPECVRRVRVPSGIVPGGEVLWRDV